jgi:predicted nucleotidyltransferase
LDLLIRRIDRRSWSEVLSRLGYHLKTERDNFIQFEAPQEGAWPVDLMLVQDPTFDPMLAASSEVEMYGTHLGIPALEHLLALKVHALKHGHIERFSKDLLDVEGLVRVNVLDMKSQKMKDLFLKYGTLKLYEQISRFTEGGER